MTESEIEKSWRKSKGRRMKGKKDKANSLPPPKKGEKKPSVFQLSYDCFPLWFRYHPSWSPQ